MNALGLVFSNIHDENISEVTRHRTMGSVPFGGRYRVIDFVLSNMTNSNINTVGIVTKNNYQSLMDHVGPGKEWDLARKNGGLYILPPYRAPDSTSMYKGKVEALNGVTSFITKTKERYVILSDCDIVANIDLADAYAKHKESGADITMLYVNRKITQKESTHSTVLHVDFDGRIIKIIHEGREEGMQKVSMNIWIIEKSLLLGMINDSVIQGLQNLEKEVLGPRCKTMKIMGYKFEGYVARIDSLQTYLQYNMDLLKPEIRKELFGKRRIFTKIKDAVPSYYAAGSNVENSIVADGCVIEGEVKNSILFRGVHIGKNAKIENSVIMQDTTIGEYARLNAVITDKNVTIRNDRVISGHETYPVYIAKGSIV